MPRGADEAPRLMALDGLRAVAAFLIVIHHAGFQSGVTFREPFGQFVGRLDVGVSIFFVISGFVLFRPYAVALFDGASPTAGRLGWWPFWRRRLLRIYPAYWVALAVQRAGGAIALGGAGGIAWYAGLVQIYDNNRVVGGITQAWSLATELGFYVLLPMFASALGRFVFRIGLRHRRPAGNGSGRRPLDDAALVTLAITLGLVAASFVWRGAAHALAPPAWEGVIRFWMPSHLDSFAAGMAMATIGVWAGRRPLVADAVAGMARRTWLAWSVAAVAFWWTATQLELAVGLDSATWERELIRQSAYTIVGIAVVLPLALGPGGRGLGRLVLGSRPFVWLGSVSYGVYLWHVAFQQWLQRWFDWEVFSGHFWTLLVGSGALAVVAGALSLRFVELPAQRLAARRERTIAHSPGPAMATAARIEPGAP